MSLSNVAATNNCKSDRSIHVAKVADYLRIMRVISLVPSWTEFLHDLGVNVVGQTKFCVHPASAYTSVSRIGGTKNVNTNAVLDLSPDLVVANKEENDKDQVGELMEQLGHDRVVVTDVRTVQEALDEMKRLGECVEKAPHSLRMVEQIQTLWGAPRMQFGRVGYAVWSSPWMVAGRDTYIHDVMRHWGIGNSFDADESESRYPSIAKDERAGLPKAPCWLLPSEPFPFKTRHLHAFSQIHPAGRFLLVDGEAFSWYGSRMLHVARHLEEVAWWVNSDASK